MSETIIDKSKVINFKSYVKQFTGFIQSFYFAIEVGKLRGSNEQHYVRRLLHLSKKELAKTILATRTVSKSNQTERDGYYSRYREAEILLTHIKAKINDEIIQEKINNYLYPLEEMHEDN